MRFKGGGLPSGQGRKSNPASPWAVLKESQLRVLARRLDGMKRDGSLQRIIDSAELRGIEIVTSPPARASTP